MPSTDRTRDFFAHAETVRRRGGAPAAVEVRATAKASDFAARASECSRRFQQTSMKLAQLTKHVQRQGLLHDPTASINQLTSSIKLDIITLKKQIEELATVQMSSRHGSRDSRQESLHTGHVVTQLQSVLLDTTRSFGNVLKDRSERLQERQDRRGHFGSAATSALGRPLNIDSPLRFRGSGGEGGGGGAASGGGDAMRPQGILQLTQLREPSVAYASSRANAVSEIESNIHELGGIFEQLNLMVMEQGEVVQRIDDNLETTLDNVSAGENELLKYFRSMGGGKWLVFKVAMVLLIFLVFFITFFV